MRGSDKTKKRIGIIGGGQLGKMMILEAKKMGFFVVILDPVENCPAHSIADEHVIGDFHDEKALSILASKVDVLTYEFEHIGVEALKKLEEENHVIYPSVQSLEIIQNKYEQKKVLQENELLVPKFIKVNLEEDIRKAGKVLGYPLILKACTGGYDGKGNAFIHTEEEIKKAYETLGKGKLPLMVEECISFTKEISVLACRGIRGQISVYPVAENEHKDHILMQTTVPALVTEKVMKKAMDLAYKVMEVFQGVGMFCVEMFVTKEEEVLINEVAPRPHNSGHYSIEGCVTSQFEQHIRAIADLPLGDTSLVNPTVMRNILGEEKYEGDTLILGMEEALEVPRVKVHLYGKETTKPKRKMGHLTVTANTIEEAQKNAQKASSYIKVISFSKEDTI